MIVTDFIVAVELSSTKIKGLAGRLNADKSVQLLAFAEENSAGCIEKGAVFNLDKTTQCLKQVLTSLEQQLGAKISKAYVGLGGRSLHGVKTTEERELNEDTKISQALIDSLKNASKENIASEHEILYTGAQEYKVGNNVLKDPVGVQGDNITASFLNIIARRTLKSNIKECFKQVGCEIAGFVVAPLATADALLSVNERRSGCALVDIGAETTTVLVYAGNKLRHLAVIPLGGRNITKDLCNHKLEEADAEVFKLRFGSAYTEEKDSKEYAGKEYRLENNKSIDVLSLEETIEARINEILLNINNQLTLSGYKDKLLGDVVLTGGTAQLPRLEEVFVEKTNISKVRVSLTSEVVMEGLVQLNANGRYNTLLGILMNGTENCKKVDLKAGLFEAEETQKQAEEARRIAEQKANEEEARRIADEEKRRQEQREREERTKQEAEFKLAEGRKLIEAAFQNIKDENLPEAQIQLSKAKELNLSDLKEEIAHAEKELKTARKQGSFLAKFMSKVKGDVERLLGDDNEDKK